jgi:hypothetical protein
MLLIKDSLVDKIILILCALAVFPLLWLFLAI